MVQAGMVTQTCWQSVKLSVIKADEQEFLSRRVTSFSSFLLFVNVKKKNKNLEIALVSVNLGPETCLSLCVRRNLSFHFFAL